MRIQDVPILPGILRDEGYDVSILGKVVSSTPYGDFGWDLQKSTVFDLGRGRNPETFYQHAQQFIQDAADGERPFFLMANSSDPHRPFYGNDNSEWYDELNPPAATPSRVFAAEEVTVPRFLPDLPDVRLEISEYYSSVRRADDTVGRLLDALEDKGVAENTLVMFLSDHGMPLPFAKSNVYLNSTRTPWIVRWPGVVQPDQMDGEFLISAVDYLPTVLDAIGVEIPEGVNGRSFLPLLRGEEQSGREYLFTQFYESAGRKQYPMRSVQSAQFGYIVNLWSDGQRAVSNDTKSGRSWLAMVQAADDDPELAARNRLYTYRVLQEFYDYENDPNALNNFMDDPDYVDEIVTFRTTLEQWMIATNDPLLESFRADVLSLKVANTAATGAPTISGVARVGEKLTAETSAITDTDGLFNAVFHYQWVTNDGSTDTDAAGETTNTYTPEADDEGKTVKVRVSFADDRGKQESLTSEETALVAPWSPVWSADMSVVEYTSVSVGATTSDLFTNIGGSAGLQAMSLWYYIPNRELRLEFMEDVPDTEHFTLEIGDLALAFPEGSSGTRAFNWLNVNIDWQDGQTLAVRVIRGMEPVEPAANSASSGLPVITGAPQVGETLTADTSDIEDADGLDDATFAYKWVSNDGTADTDIEDAIDSTYTLREEDAGRTIKVRVSFTDAADN